MISLAPPTLQAITPAAGAALHRDAGPQRGDLQRQVVDAIRTRHYSRRTEQAYWHWTKTFVLWSGKRHPLEMGAPEIGQFLTWLATERGVPFVELDREIEREAGTSMNEILLLHGQAGYRRYERRALFRIAEDHADGVVMTTGGSIGAVRKNAPTIP